MKFSRQIWLSLAGGAAALVGVVIFAVWPRETEPPPCLVHSFEGSRFTVCSFDPSRDQMRLISRNADGDYVRSFAELSTHLGDDADRVRFAMNAGMYDAAGAPIGLFVAEGDEEHRLNQNRGPGNFHMMPNGVFWQDRGGAVYVDTSAGFANATRPVWWATQSGPMLVIDGALHPRFQHDGPSRYVRNGVGVRDGIAYFVISSGAVSFGRFARFFRDELGCDNALFLDGSVSSLWSPQLERRDGNQELGPLIAVLARD